MLQEHGIQRQNSFLVIIPILDKHIHFFFGGGRVLNPIPCIYYALSLPIELSSRGPHTIIYKHIQYY